METKNSNLITLLSNLNDNEKEKILNFLEKLDLLSGKHIDSTVHRLREIYLNYDYFDDGCMSIGQLKSKQWLVNELKNIKKEFNEILICAGWYGTLAHMLFKDNEFKINKIKTIDIDEKVEKIADSLNFKWLIDNWRFKAITSDIFNIDYNNIIFNYLKKETNEIIQIKSEPDLIINTSCEHLIDYKKWFEQIPKNMMCVVQNNNMFYCDQHVNCVNSLEEFKESMNFSELYFSGELILKKYKRFMLIGKK